MVGYHHYLESIRDLTDGKELISSGMMQEVDRCRAAVERAQAGATVAFVSSGDAGVYGMAGLALEMIAGENVPVAIEVVAGISAANSAASRMGAPLMLDYACISLSDLLVKWDQVRQRVEAVAAADLVVALYNPKSNKRVRQIEEVAEIFRQHRPGNTPVGIATAVGTDQERIVMSDLDHFLDEQIGMRTIVIVGNRSSECLNGWFLTPRGYKL